MKRIFVIFICILKLSWADGKEISLRESLDSAQMTSPELKAAQVKEISATSDVAIAKSEYYPKIEAQAIESTGLSASNSDLGITGVMGSPYRTGFAAGVYALQTLYDFGRTANRLEQLKKAVEGQKQETEIAKYRIDLAVIESYFSCNLNRSQFEIWKELLQQSQLIEKEVDRFVKTGQRSIVDRYLSESQIEQSTTSMVDYGNRTKESAKRLAIMIGQSIPPECPKLPEQANFELHKKSDAVPLIEKARTEIMAAQSGLELARSENWPKLVAMASSGYMDNVQFVTNYNYSAGIGITIPLFEGYRISSEIDQNAARLSEKTYAAQAVEQFVAETNQRYDEITTSMILRLEHLQRELKLAQTAFDVAKTRYFKFQGGLLDLRAALDNLTRVLIDVNETRARLFVAQASKEVLNGAE